MKAQRDPKPQGSTNGWVWISALYNSQPSLLHLLHPLSFPQSSLTISFAHGQNSFSFVISQGKKELGSFSGFFEAQVKMSSQVYYILYKYKLIIKMIWTSSLENCASSAFYRAKSFQRRDLLIKYSSCVAVQSLPGTVKLIFFIVRGSYQVNTEGVDISFISGLVFTAPVLK